MTESRSRSMRRECQSVQKELALLSPEDQLPPHLAEHLRTCAACSDARSADLAVWHALAEYRVPSVPATLLENVERRIARPLDELARRRARQDAPRPLRPVRFALAAAAMILLGAAAGSWMGSQRVGVGTEAPVSASAPNAFTEHAELFAVDPPGSLTWAYAPLRAGGGLP
jgi:predicted anti-sigma-YlaC factor YlaD